MGVSMSTYIGRYFIVHMPMYTKEVRAHKCPECGSEKNVLNFCANCGIRVPMIKRDYMDNMSELFEEAFGDADRFFDHHVRTTDPDSGREVEFYAVMPNHTCQGGLIIDEYDNEALCDIPEKNTHEDWEILKRELIKRKLIYEDRFGIVNYWIQ